MVWVFVLQEVDASKDASPEIDFSGLLDAEDRDSDTEDKSLTALERATILLDAIQEHKGCTYEQAYEMALKNKSWLDQVRVSPHKMKKLKVGTRTGKKKFQVSLFKKLIDSSDFQLETNVALEELSGLRADKAVDECITYQWPDCLFVLFVLQTGEYLLRSQATKGETKGAAVTRELKTRRAFMVMLKTLLHDMFMQSQEQVAPDLRYYFLTALDLYMDKAKNKPRKSLFDILEGNRGWIKGRGPGVHMNFMSDYNKRVGGPRRGGYSTRGGGSVGGSGKVKIGKRVGYSTRGGGSSGGGGGSSEYYTNSKFKSICAAFNSKKGCPHGRNCNYKHVCLACPKKNHGIWDCYALEDHYAAKVERKGRRNTTPRAGTKRGYGQMLMKQEVVEAVAVAPNAGTIKINGATYVLAPDKK